MNRLLITLVCLCATIPAGVIAQDKPSTSDQKRTIRVGIALMANQSGRQVTQTWERDQLLRELQRIRTNRKSDVVIEAVSLEASSKEDAGEEAAQKKCEYFVLTTMLDPRHGPGISGGPDGHGPAPIILGNGNTSRTLAIDYSILEVSDFRSISDGTSTATVDETGDIRAADEAMRMTAHSVASELRKQRPRID